MKTKLTERASVAVAKLEKANLFPVHNQAYKNGYAFGAYDGWLAGYKAAKRERRK